MPRAAFYHYAKINFERLVLSKWQKNLRSYYDHANTGNSQGEVLNKMALKTSFCTSPV